MLLENEKIKIRPLISSDVTKDYFNWFKDKLIKKYVVNTTYKDINHLKKYVFENSKKKNILFLGIFTKKNKHIGNIKFEKINIKKKSAVMGILIGNKNFRNKGLSASALTMTMQYLNKKKKIKYFFLGVNKKNIQAIESYYKSGFRISKEKKNTLIMIRNYDLLNLSKFSLGTAQFGMNYGVNNKFGKVKIHNIKKIIQYSKKIGIRSIDTATTYGNAEKILGNIGVKNFKVTTKLPYIPDNKITLIDRIVKNSLSNLKIKKLNCLLIHSSKNLEKKTNLIIKKMKNLKFKGLVKNIGISVTNTKDIYRVLKKFDVDVIQIPYNILDRRLERKSLINLINKKKIKVQSRSIFLQGLLFKKYSEIPFKIKNRSKHLKKIKNFLSQNNNKKLDQMINFVYKNNLPYNHIIGVDNLKQLNEISKIQTSNYLKFRSIASNDENLINPSLW